MILTLLAGYVAPSLVGLAGAWLLAGNRITLLLWVAVALLLAMLVLIRNVFGVLSLLVTGGVVLAVSWYASPQVQAAFAWTSVWFLLLGGVRPVVELQRLRSRGRMPRVRRRPARPADAVPGAVLGDRLRAGQPGRPRRRRAAARRPDPDRRRPHDLRPPARGHRSHEDRNHRRPHP